MARKATQEAEVETATAANDDSGAETEVGLIKITYVKSAIGYHRRQKETVRSLGLKHLGDSVIQADVPAVRGMVTAVSHLVRVESVEAPEVSAAKANGEGKKR
jgi:large subunit ribosomal protein L30